ncbi:MAG: hypothetical protein ACT4P7_12840 [Gemmatimonadaceae bacterium]
MVPGAPPGGGGDAGDGGGGRGVAIADAFVNNRPVFNNNPIQIAAGGAGGGAFASGGTSTATATAQPARRRRVPEITLAVRVTNPLGDANERDTIDIQWVTDGGAPPRTIGIELFAPQTGLSAFDRPDEFRPIVTGARDTGSFRWMVAVPSGHYNGLTISSPTNPVLLPGFFIRVTVTDSSGFSASDTTPMFAIVRR